MNRLAIILVSAILTISFQLAGQETFPLNDVANPREGCTAFIHATIIKDSKTTLQDASMIIRHGKIENIGSALPIPKDAVVIDCKGKYIYPSFIDIYSDYGV